MIKRILFIISILFVSSQIFGLVEVRLLGNVETTLGEDLRKTFEVYQSDQNNKYGFSWEVIIDNIGFGGHYGILFNKIESSEFPGEQEWWLDWKGDLYISYHLFGAKTFLDPFAELGFGNAGITFVNNTGEQLSTKSRNPVTNMSLFPYAAIGGSINLSGLLLGAKVNYYLENSAIPGTKFSILPMKTASLVMFAGISL